MNRVIIAGNLGADPDLRYTKSGTAVAEMRIATREREKRGEQWEDHTEWHRVILWGKRAESLGKILTKGSFVVVAGKNRTRQWEAKDGGKRYTTEIVADEIELTGGGGGSGRRRSEEPQPEEPYQDDLPF